MLEDFFHFFSIFHCSGAVALRFSRGNKNCQSLFKFFFIVLLHILFSKFFFFNKHLFSSPINTTATMIRHSILHWFINQSTYFNNLFCASIGAFLNLLFRQSFWTALTSCFRSTPFFQKELFSPTMQSEHCRTTLHPFCNSLLILNVIIALRTLLRQQRMTSGKRVRAFFFTDNEP